MDEARAKLDRALANFRRDGIPVKPLVKISHRTSYGITETALEERCNLIVMGRARRVGLLERFAATTVDSVVHSAPVQVMVVSAEHWPRQIKTVLLSYESGPHSELTIDLAGALAAAHEAKVRTVHVLPRTATTDQTQQAGRELAGAIGARHPMGEVRVLQSHDIVTGLLRQARDAELIVMGGTEAGLLEQLMGYALPLELADRTSKAVITVYEMAADPTRWLR